MDFSSHNPKTTNALSLAARRNDVENVRRLLKKINPNIVDNRGWTCLHEAAFHNSFECLQIILNHRACRPLVESHEGHTALYVACQSHLTITFESVEYLLKNVPDIANYGSREGYTPLHYVSRQGNNELLQVLLEYDTMVNVIDFDGDTPLHEACMGSFPDTVTTLLHAGADPQVANERNATPLHMACARGSLESVKCLMPFIGDINPQDDHGNTPLMTACSGESEDIIEYLLEHGADPNIQNYNRKMAINVALERGLVRGFKLLFQATDRHSMNNHLVYLALSPNYLVIDIIDTILNSDLDPEVFMFPRPWAGQMEIDGQVDSLTTTVATRELSTYVAFAPLALFINVAEYIYKLSVEKFNELFCLLLMKGLSVNASYKEEMPPLVWLQYCPHSVCFEHILDMLVEFGCNVDYCSDKVVTFGTARSHEMRSGPNIEHIHYRPQSSLIKHLPDAIYAALLLDPVTLPPMMKYSIQCDPGYILRAARIYGIIDQFSSETILQMMKMIDSECEISDYEATRYYIPPLRHFARLKVRDTIRKQGIHTTNHFLHYLHRLPIPQQIKYYIRFM